jgi:hypothetical protein
MGKNDEKPKEPPPKDDPRLGIPLKNETKSLPESERAKKYEDDKERRDGG